MMRLYVHRDRKGQMEMIGLVIIVILITIGMLFLAQFALKDSPQKKIFTRKGLAVSTMTSIMKTTVNASGCVGLQVESELLEDCAEGKRFGGYRYYCDGKNSCDYLNEDLVPVLLNATLGQWNKRYEFNSVLKDDSLIHVSARGGCPKTRDRDTSDEFYLNIQGIGIVSSVLYICE